MNAGKWLAVAAAPGADTGASQIRWGRWAQRLLAAAMVMSLALPGRSEGASCVDYGAYMHWVGTAVTSGRAYDVAVAGDLAYVATTDGLTIVDVSLPSTPAVIGSLGLGGAPIDVAAAGEYAYVVAESGAVYAVDVSVPEAPRLAGVLQLPDRADYDVAAWEGRAYVAAREDGIYVIDMRRPAAPVIEGWLDTPGEAREITIAGGRAYVADWIGGFHVVDISVPGSPYVLGTALAEYGGSVDVGVSLREPGSGASYAYVAVRGIVHGVFTVDVSDPTNPLPIAVAFPLQEVRNVVAVETAVFLFRGSGRGLEVYDATDPTALMKIGSVDLGDTAIDVDGTHAYLTDSNLGLHVIDITSVKGVVPFASMPHIAVSVAVEGRYAYAMDARVRGGSVRVIDFGHSGGPVVVAEIPVEQGWGLALRAPYLYFQDRGGLRVADISNPALPVVMSTLPGAGCRNMTAEGSMVFGAYANGPGGGLIAVDVANPKSPKLVQHLQTTDQLHGIILRDGVAFCAADFRGLAVYDVSQPWGMRRIGGAGIEFPYFAFGVDLAGDYLYLAEGLLGLYSSRGRLEIFNIMDPANPFAVGRAELPTEVYDVAVSEALAYVAGSKGGLYIVDVADPQAPVLIGGADLPGEAIDLAVTESAVHVACWEGGLHVLPLQCAPRAGLPTVEHGSGAAPRLEIRTVGGVVAEGDRAQFSFVLPSAGEVRVGIYSPQGRLIRSLISERLAGGTHLATWDGRDGRGRRASAGAYFVAMTWNGQSAATRVIALH